MDFGGQGKNVALTSFALFHQKETFNFVEGSERILGSIAKNKKVW